MADNTYPLSPEQIQAIADHCAATDCDLTIALDTAARDGEPYYVRRT